MTVRANPALAGPIPAEIPIGATCPIRDRPRLM
jgi:hypothetical protein